MTFRLVLRALLQTAYEQQEVILEALLEFCRLPCQSLERALQKKQREIHFSFPFLQRLRSIST